MVHNHFNTVTELMQSSLKVVDNWCETQGLTLYPKKTETVLFTRERKTDGVLRRTYQDVRLNLKKKKVL